MHKCKELCFNSFNFIRIIYFNVFVIYDTKRLIIHLNVIFNNFVFYLFVILFVI